MGILLDQPLAVELSGTDAAKILHNLTTNQILSVEIGKSIETFVTDVRGWIVAHGLVFRVAEERWLLLGQHPQTAAVCSHIDRYIIREQATVQDRSATTQIELVEQPQLVAESSSGEIFDARSSAAEALAVPFPAFGPQAALMVRLGLRAPVTDQPSTPVAAWEQLRIAHFWPRMGVDIWDKCIPQELDRDPHAISFTKGCYLGQETIARLDARGQIQKKLCLLKLGELVSANDKLLLNDQEVGYITSATQLANLSMALSVIRRGHFAVNTKLNCRGLVAEVVDASTGGDYLK